MAHQAFAGLLVVCRNAVLLHPGKNAVQNLLVLICRVTIENGNLRLYGVENEYGNEVNFQPDEAFAGHLSYIIDCLPPVNGVDDVTTLKTEEEAV